MPDRAVNKHVYAVVLVGGKGKRLRPLSSDAKPKAFLSVTRNKRTMFRNTIDRIRRIIPDENIVVVANKLHARLVKKDMPRIRKENLLLEPASRNTAPAVTLAASAIAKRDRDAVIVILPTDHYIEDEAGQLACLQAGIDFMHAVKEGITVLGLAPRYPSTQFGYIKVKDQGSRIRDVEKFVEKPDFETAKQYVQNGRYLWNAGIFIFHAGNFMRAVKALAPAIYRSLKDATVTKRSYEKLPDISLDYAVMEKARRVYCVTGSYGWNDMGGFEALREVLRREGRRFVEKDGKIVKIL